MLERLFANQAYHDLKAALDLAAARQEAIAQNIANADTPGYRRKMVTFGDELFAAVDRRARVRGPRRPRAPVVLSATPRLSSLQALDTAGARGRWPTNRSTNCGLRR
jgi:flagellar basal body rod protein FlgG